MSELIFINGAMGAGKSTTARELSKILPNNVWLDGDDCLRMTPFTVDDVTKAVIIDNIVYMLNNFLSCGRFEYVIFSWVMHTQGIINAISDRLNVSPRVFTLMCSGETLTARLTNDIERGVRANDGVTERALAYLPLYDDIDSTKIFVSDKSPAEVAENIALMLR